MEENLSLYYIFHTVARFGNISRAAKELYISQPAISKAIAKLEANLSVTLFRRSSRGVILTEEGSVLYEQTLVAFQALQTATRQLELRKELGVGQIRIGVSTTLCKYLLLPYLKEFTRQYPNIKIIIECHSTFHTIKLLEEHQLDIGLIGKPDQLRDLTFETITEIRDSFVASKSYLSNLTQSDDEISTKELFQKGSIMLLDEKNITRMYLEKYFVENNIQLNQVLEISNMDLLIEFAKIGLGITCVIREFIEKDLKDGSLVELPLHPPLKPREVGLSYHGKIVPTEAMNRLIHFIRNYNRNIT